MNKQLILSICILLTLINYSNCGCLRVKQLTTDLNQHDTSITILKMTSDSKNVFSISYDGNIKVWKLIGNSLILKQSWSLNEEFPLDAINALYVWQDGLKIFVGSTSRIIKIYNYISSKQLYDLVNVQTVNTRSRIQDFYWITSIYVNNLGNQLFVGVKMDGFGISRFVYNGQEWVKNDPESIMRQIGRLQDRIYINFIQMTKDQTKLIILNSNTLLIFNFDGINYSFSQKIVSSSSIFTCKFSQDESIINCFGYVLQFGAYRFDKSLNRFVDISSPNTMQPVGFTDAFMDSNNYLIATRQQDFAVYKYKFQYSNGVASYSEVDKVSLQPLSNRPYRIVSQPLSKFHLVGTWQNKPNTDGGRIYMLSCYQLHHQDVISQ